MNIFSRVVGLSRKLSSWKDLDKLFVYVLVFLTPLFFLPWTSNYLELNKQALFAVLIFLAAVFAVLRCLSSEDLSIAVVPTNVAVVFLLAVYGLSTAFSLSKYNSFWGWPFNVSTSFITLLLFVLFYFLVVNTFKTAKDSYWAFLLLAISGLLAALVNALQLFGKFIFPWDFARQATFNVIGTPNAAALFFAVLTPIIIAVAFLAQGILRWILSVAIILLVFNLAVLGFNTAWLVFSIEMIVLFVFGMYGFGLKKEKLALVAIVLLAVSLVFIVLKPVRSSIIDLPLEAFPSQKTTIDIAGKTLLSSFFLGSGPGNFSYNYAKFKPAEVNQTAFWSIRFETGPSEVLNKIITTGIFGVSSLLFILGTALWLGFRQIKLIIVGKNNEYDFLLLSGVVSGLIGLTVSYFLYPANFILWLVFWIFLSNLAVLSAKQNVASQTKLGTKTTPKVFLILILILIFGFILAGVPKYLAEVRYLSGLNAWRNQDLNLTIKQFAEAARLNPTADIYHRELSQAYLAKLNAIVAQEDVSSEEVRLRVQNVALAAAQEVERAVTANPKNAVNWSVKGITYQGLIGIIDGAGNAGVAAWNQAIELEPLNPSVFTEMSRTYLALVDFLGEKSADRETNLNFALDNAGKAISLKADYWPAYLLQATTFARKNMLTEAVQKMEELKSALPDDTEVAFQLGVMYYNNNQLEEARTELERLLRLNENYATAHYFLGLIHDKKNNKAEAIAHFEVLEKLNPEDGTVKDILSNLRSGKNALDGVQ